MISKKIEEAFNAQINAEFWSGYLYLALSSHFEEMGRKGTANWFRIQFQEEQAHALALMDYVHARGGKVLLLPINEVKCEWKTMLEAFSFTLGHERKVTAMIHSLYALAEEEKDYASRQVLNSFIAEQVEEEENVQDIIDNLTLVGDNGTGLYQIDQELASRTYTAPVLFRK